MDFWNIFQFFLMIEHIFVPRSTQAFKTFEQILLYCLDILCHVFVVEKRFFNLFSL